MSTVVFLGGPPGSGKSTLAAEVAANLEHVRTVTAGQLIRAGLGAQGSYVRPPVADHERAAFFQAVLVAEFDRVRPSHEGTWLLDGHYAVPTGTGLAEVPVEVFRRLGCSHFALMAAEAETIETRLRMRGGADWWDGSCGAIEELLQREERHAQVVAEALGIELVRWSGPDDVPAIPG